MILTGLSGSGKSTVLKTFEDLGYYCVDNLPVDLIPTFSELHVYGNSEIERAALLVDAREGDQLERLPAIYKQDPPRSARDAGIHRSHRRRVAAALQRDAPAASAGPRPPGARRPEPRARADGADPQACRRGDRHHAVQRPRAARSSSRTAFRAGRKRPMMVSLVSFGYRYGVPADADLVFDVRFLPNPHFIPRLRKFSGRNPKVARYIRSFPQTGEFLRRIEGLLTYLIPHYIREGKSYLTIAFGCTGGRHRSVMMAEAVRTTLAKRGYTAKVVHRDLDKWAS